MITVYKDTIERSIPAGKLPEYLLAGWSESKVQPNIISIDEIVTLKPPVKSKGTVRQSLDNDISKGD